MAHTCSSRAASDVVEQPQDVGPFGVQTRVARSNQFGCTGYIDRVRNPWTRVAHLSVGKQLLRLVK